MRHGLLALRDTLQQDKELNIHNTSLGIVGRDRDFEIIEGEALQGYLEMLGDETARSRRGAGGGRSAADSIAADEVAGTEQDIAPMDTSS